MPDIENKIAGLKSRLEAKKNEKTRAEANLEMAQKQLEEVTKQITDLGYVPDALPDAILDLETIINTNLAEAERILNETEGLSTEQVKERIGLS